jgi:hypothetical protein
MNRQANIGNLVERIKNAGCDLRDHAWQEQIERLLMSICCAIEFLVLGLRRKDEDQHFRRCVNCVLFLVLARRSVI